MNLFLANLPLLLKCAAAAQLAVAVLNLFLVRLMKWEPDIERMPLLVREVFRVHAWFITITLAIFGTITWRFAAEMANGNEGIASWLCIGIGLFWAIRTLLQVFYYSSAHWKGQPARIVAHVALLFCYGGMAIIYLASAIARGGRL